MKKVVFIAILIIILIYGYGCRKKEFRFYHDIDEIMKVEIVHVLCSETEGITSQETIFTIRDIDTFIKDFGDLVYYEGFFDNPQGIENDEVVFKISYVNGEYELVNSIGKALYFHETGLKNYKGYHQFDEEEFSELIEKYMNNDWISSNFIFDCCAKW